MGLLIGGAVFPTAFAITWDGQTRAGAIAGALSGLAAGMIAWLTTAHQYFGGISISTTGEEYSTLAGTLPRARQQSGLNQDRKSCCHLDWSYCECHSFFDMATTIFMGNYTLNQCPINSSCSHSRRGRRCECGDSSTERKRGQS